MGEASPSPFQKLLNDLQPDLARFFRVELAAEDAAVGGGGADLPPAVGRVGQTVRALQGLCLIAVDKIALLPCAQLRQRGAGKIGDPRRDRAAPS